MADVDVKIGGDVGEATDALKGLRDSLQNLTAPIRAVQDSLGGMAEILDIIGKAGVNIEYMYAFTFRHGKEAVLVFRFENPDRAIEALKTAGRDVLDAVSLFSKSK